MNKNRILKRLPLLAAGLCMGAALMAPVNGMSVQAKGLDDAIAEFGNIYYAANNTIYFSQSDVVFDGFDFDDIHIEIQSGAKNVTFKNCTGIKSINIQESCSGITLENMEINAAGETNGIQIYGTDCTVKNCTVKLAGNYGILLAGGGNKVEYCTVLDNEGAAGIITKSAKNIISNNTIKNSAHAAIIAEEDKESVISGNTIDNSCVKGDVKLSDYLAEGVVLSKCDGTVFKENTVTNTKGWKLNGGNYGNAIAIAYSKNLTVSDNKIGKAGSYNIQVSFSSSNITVSGNVFEDAARSSVNISRGASDVLLKGNEIKNCGEYGVIISENSQATLEKNIITGSKLHGVNINASKATVKGNTIGDNARFGIAIEASSTVTAEDNSIYSSDLKSGQENGMGISVSGGSVAALNRNVVFNYGLSGVYGDDTSTVDGKQNQVGVSGDKFLNNAYLIKKNFPGQTLANNTLNGVSITGTTFTGQTYFADVPAGAVIGQTIYESKANGSGKITVTYPEATISNVSCYAQDENENTIVVNTTKDFVLSQVGKVDRAEAEKAIKEFVARFYQLILERNADEGGLNYWADRLLSGQDTGAGVLDGFIGSDEFAKKGLSYNEMVTLTYKACFNREPDANGLKYWSDFLENGCSMHYIADGFAQSKEFATLCASFGVNTGSVKLTEWRDKNAGVTAFVVRNYTKALGREKYDVGGLNYWCEYILSKQDARAAAAEATSDGFFNSNEFLKKNTNDEEFLEYAYQTFFGRASDEAGRAYWLDQMNGGASRDDVLKGFAASKEFGNIMSSYGL